MENKPADSGTLNIEAIRHNQKSNQPQSQNQIGKQVENNLEINCAMLKERKVNFKKEIIRFFNLKINQVSVRLNRILF